ncbi:glycoside hydrolase family 9 protein [Paenibacillus kobensis]|uniref:glycoside hydrolase family 9 protein n=1 Tax=Paenibacillus kobensis TaxID=59841 RepID=UPI000FD74DC6|nr:glycoside hydrolase family 9 protein [Paenibacillus kobensis]
MRTTQGTRVARIVRNCGIVALCAAASIVSLEAGVRPAQAATTPVKYNYAEALQKSLYFYDAEKSGPGITGGRLEWRGNSDLSDKTVGLGINGSPSNQTNMSAAFIQRNKAVLDPDGNGTVDLSGGFHDAGDHVKFGLPQTYAASTLGWGFNEFRDAYIESGQESHMLEELKWFSDYFLRSTFRDASGNVIAFNYMVGNGTVDHAYWGPPELQDPAAYPRPATFATAETPASDQAAGAAAALAIMYLNTKDTDPQYAALCLDNAKALYTFAKTYRGLGNSDGFYNSGYDEDELSWAAVWLYEATGTAQYITDITAATAGGAYTGYLKKIMNSTADTWQNQWVHSWDTVWGGVFMKLATLFPTNSQYDYYARWNLEYWSGGAVKHQDLSDTNYLAKTPGGYAFLSTWGSARYNTAAQLCALIYSKHKNRTDFAEWAKGQMDYIMGDNPMGYSYIVGFPTVEGSAKHPHHRAAHGSKTNSMLVPADDRHTLWGALVGGPNANDVHNDVTTDYISNEVAVDYNAGFVGALAGLYDFYGQGQLPLANFPPKEAAVQQYYAESKLEQENAERSQITITVHNESVHPPHNESGMSAHYYFNISELTAAGQSINDVSIAVYYDEQKSATGQAVKITGPLAADAAAGIYYYQFDWSGASIYGDRDLQFAIMAKQDSAFKSNWNPANDWSRQGITATAAINNRVPVYLNGVKAFGEEPGGSTPVQIPAAPTGLTASAGNAQAMLTWTASAGAASYNVKRATVSGGPYTTVATGLTGTSYTNTALTNGATYYYVVSAVNTAGESANSAQASATPQAAVTVPAAPTGLTAAAGDAQAALTWTASAGAASYNVKRAVVSGGPYTTVATGITGTTYTNTALTNGTTYYYVVSAVNTAGESANSAQTSATPAGVTTPPEGTLAVQYKVNNANATDNMIYATFNIKNTGTAAVGLSGLKLRYYLTKDGASGMSCWTDYAQVGSSNVSGSFASVSPAKTTADTYVELSFSAGAGSIPAGGQSGDIQIRIAKSDWSNWNENNDYSFDGTKTAYANWSKVTLYQNGTLVWGQQP